MKKIAGILGIITLLAALLVPASAVFAQDVVVSIDAPAEVDADSDFIAEVDIANVENFDVAQYDVVFDDTVLRLDDVTDGVIDTTAIPVTAWNLVEAGRVRIVNNVPGTPGVTGSGTLADLHFHVIGTAGEVSVIDLQNELLGDNVGVEIAATWVDGQVTVAGVPVDAVVVSIDAPALVAPDSDFVAEVDIANVENFDVAQYDVVFDDTVLRLDDVTDGVIDGTAIPVVAENLVDGRVTIVNNVPGTPGVTGSGTLAELHFHVIGAAGEVSVIDFQNELLGDNVGVEIAATWIDGAVTVGVPAPTEFDETRTGVLAEGDRSGVLFTILGGATELEITLTTAASPEPDMDLELYDGATFVIGWKDAASVDAIINSKDPVEDAEYDGDFFDYSGWDGGNEYITADGPLGRSYDLKVFGFEAGTYTVTVSYTVPVDVVDVTPPVIDIIIGGASTVSLGNPVTITVSATDPSGVLGVLCEVYSPFPYEDWGAASASMFSFMFEPSQELPEIPPELKAVAAGYGSEIILTFTPPIAGTYTVLAWGCDTEYNFDFTAPYIATFDVE